MRKIVEMFLTLEKKDQLIFFLLCTTIINFIMTFVKFTFSIIIPSLWFGVNAGFGFVLTICRFITVKKYREIRLLKNKEKVIKEEYKNYLQNGIMLILLGIMYFFVSSYMYYNSFRFIYDFRNKKTIKNIIAAGF